jgi:hypothetical protein
MSWITLSIANERPGQAVWPGRRWFCGIRRCLPTIRVVLTTADPEVVRRHLELHMERLEEWFITHRRRVATVERILADAAGRDRVATRPLLEGASGFRGTIPSGRNLRGRKWIHPAALAVLVLTACAQGEGNSAPPTRSDPVDGATATVTPSSPPSGGSDCSAAASSASLEPQPGLPDRVEEVRQAIAKAAGRCEYGRLAALAREDGDQFTFTFGAADDPGPYWRRGEEAGRDPMKFLAGMLDRPFGQVSAGDLTLYIWPSAATYPSWAEVPPEARNALRPLYGDEDFQQFAQFGSYIGYRVGITETGDWLYFVAGD